MGSYGSKETFKDKILEQLESHEFPSLQGSTYILKDGRAMGYSETVHPQDDTANLFPILFFHGIPGSRLFVPPAIKSIKGIRWIVLERPGFGLSTLKKVTFLEWASDVEEFIVNVIKSNVSIVAYSAGGPWSLAVSFLYPNLIRKVAIISSISPHGTSSYSGMSFTNKCAWFCVSAAPSLVRYLTRKDGERTLQQVFTDSRDSISSFPACDQSVISRSNIELLFLISEYELVSRGQFESIANEYALWGKSWGFPLSNLKVNIQIWHGKEDNATAIGMGRYLSTQINCPLIEVEDGGHFLIFDYLPNIIEWIIEDLSVGRNL